MNIFEKLLNWLGYFKQRDTNKFTFTTVVNKVQVHKIEVRFQESQEIVTNPIFHEAIKQRIAMLLASQILDARLCKIEYQDVGNNIVQVSITINVVDRDLTT